MSRLSEQQQAAIRAAGELHRKPNGDFHRSGVKALAASNGISERQVRRILSESPRVPGKPPEIPMSVIDRLRTEDGAEGHAKRLLLSLTVGAGNRKVAHAHAQKHFGYVKSYRSFLRDIDRLDPALVAGAERGYKALVDCRIYQTVVIPHRNHTWYIDHTQADIFVLPDRGNVPFRPWLTVVVDGSTGMYMALEAWDGHLNTERFTQAITRAAAGDMVHRDELPTVGGLPMVIVCDNAKEHLAHAVEEGCLRIGIVVSPTTPYHSWENGKVEAAHRAIRQSFLATLPGYTGGGVRPDGTPRFAPPAGRTADAPPQPDRWPTGLMKMSQFQALLEEYRIERNATVKDSKGLTPMDKWLADPTPLTFMAPDVMLAHLTVTDRLHTVQKSGIRFRNHDYISEELAPYRTKGVTVRYLATVKDWIEVFDGPTYIGRAWLADRLTDQERDRMMLQRGRIEKEYRQTEHEARRMRSHLAMALDEDWDPDDLPAPPTPTGALPPDDAPTSGSAPVIHATGRRKPEREKSQQRQAQADLANRLLSDGFTLEDEAS